MGSRCFRIGVVHSGIFGPRIRFRQYPRMRSIEAVGLFFGEQAGVVFVVVLVPVDDDVFGGRNQTVLDAAEAADRLLIGSRMEEADILRIPGSSLGRKIALMCDSEL